MWQRVLYNSVYNSKANIAGGDKKLAEQDL